MMIVISAGIDIIERLVVGASARKLKIPMGPPIEPWAVCRTCIVGRYGSERERSNSANMLRMIHGISGIIGITGLSAVLAHPRVEVRFPIGFPMELLAQWLCLQRCGSEDGGMKTSELVEILSA